MEASWSSFNSMLVAREGGRKKVFVCHHLVVRKFENQWFHEVEKYVYC